MKFYIAIFARTLMALLLVAHARSESNPSKLSHNTQNTKRIQAPVNICKTSNLQKPENSFSFTQKEKFEPRSIIEFPFKLTFGFFKTIYWPTMSTNSKFEKISSTISKEATSDPTVSSLFNGDHATIKILSDEVAHHFKNRKKLPSILEVKVDASRVFVNALVQDKLAAMKLGCSGQNDLAQLRDRLLEEFNSCLDKASTETAFKSCMTTINYTIAYRVGHLALQLQLKSTLREALLDEKQTQDAMSQALRFYESCAQRRVLISDTQYTSSKIDREVETQVCVAEAVLATAPSLAKIKIKEKLSALGVQGDKLDIMTENALSQVKSPACTFASYLKSRPPFSREQYSNLQSIFSKKTGLENFKTGLTKCVDEVAAQTGTVMLRHMISSETAIKDLFTKEELNSFTDDILKNSYAPAIEALKARKSKDGVAIIDPLQTKETVMAYAGQKMIEKMMPQKLDSLLQNLEGAEELKEQTMEKYNTCVASVGEVTQRILLDCLRESLGTFAAQYSGLMAEKHLGKNVTTEFPDSKSRIQEITTKCVVERFSEASDLTQVPYALEGLDIHCFSKVAQEIVPDLAERSLRKALAGKGILDEEGLLLKQMDPLFLQLKTELNICVENSRFKTEKLSGTEKLSSYKDSILSCMSLYARDGAYRVSNHLVEQSIKRYFPGTNNELAVEAQKVFGQKLQTCLANIPENPQDPKFANKVSACLMIESSQLALRLGQLKHTQTDASPLTIIDQLIVLSSEACSFAEKEECSREIEKLNSKIAALEGHPNLNVDTLKNIFYTSSFADLVIRASIGSRINKILIDKLLPLKDSIGSPGDSLEKGISTIASTEFLKYFLEETPEGKAFVSNTKAKLLSDPNFNLHDPSVEREAKTALLQDKKSGSFTDRILKLVAEPIFDDSIKNLSLFKKLWTSTTGYTKNYDTAAANPAAQKARDSLNEVLRALSLEERVLNKDEIRTLIGDIQSKSLSQDETKKITLRYEGMNVSPLKKAKLLSSIQSGTLDALELAKITFIEFKELDNGEIEKLKGDIMVSLKAASAEGTPRSPASIPYTPPIIVGF